MTKIHHCHKIFVACYTGNAKRSQNPGCSSTRCYKLEPPLKLLYFSEEGSAAKGEKGRGGHPTPSWTPGSATGRRHDSSYDQRE